MTVSIIPEGGLVQRHTSVLLDLKNRANVYRFMNIIVDETPIIPYEVREAEQCQQQQLVIVLHRTYVYKYRSTVATLPVLLGVVCC